VTDPQGDVNDRDELSRSLRRLRLDAGLTQVQVSERTGLAQSRLSGAESGKRFLDAETIVVLARLYQVAPQEQQRLVELARELHAASLDSRMVFQRASWHTNHFNQRIQRIEEESARVQSYQPAMVIGPLQTRGYAATVFSGFDPAAAAMAVETRLARGQRIADADADADRAWTVLLTEGALMWNMGGDEVMAEQVRHLIEITRWPHVRLGIITRDTPATFTVHHGFHIYDGRTVHIGTITASALSTDPRDLTEYISLFARLEQLARYDDEARAALARIGNMYRNGA